jgi:GT2 family glycosyltransferase
VIALEADKGLAAARHVAAGQARGQYLIWLSIETVVTPGWVGRLLRHHHRDPSAGVVAPLTNRGGSEQYHNYRELEGFALALARKNMGAWRELDAAPPVCALTPRAVWEQAGEPGHDDFSLRVRQHNLRIVVAEDCFVHCFDPESRAKPEDFLV